MKPKWDIFELGLGLFRGLLNDPRQRKLLYAWTNTLSLDDARIRDMWLNMAWLTPCDNAIPREALVYTWLPFCEAEEVAVCFIHYKYTGSDMVPFAPVTFAD